MRETGTVAEAGGVDVGDGGVPPKSLHAEVINSSAKKDKGSKEQKKKPKHNLKEKRKLKNEKKSK